MCGIVGYCGKENGVPIILNGLKKLEYRGYDSGGLATVGAKKLEVVKAVGRIANLSLKTEGMSSDTAIGHTRWATHGAPSERNSHPHLSADGKIAVVHNGIIENFMELKSYLEERSFSFYSDTDTEAVAKLAGYYYTGDMLEAVIKTTRRIAGSYALAFLHAGDHCIYAVCKDNPLVIGLGQNANYLASDIPALAGLTDRFILPDAGEIVKVTAENVIVYNLNGEKVQKEIKSVTLSGVDNDKGEIKHYMLKEIYEQPEAVRATLTAYVRDGRPALALPALSRLSIVACGSAYHAGILGKYFIESHARVPVDVELGSEYRYKNPVAVPDTLALAVSQSGETADTLAAIRLAASMRQPVWSIVNVPTSSLARITMPVVTRAGAEIAVATTKGYTTQAAVLYLMGLSLRFDETLFKELLTIDKKIAAVLADTDAVKKLASRLSAAKYVFFIGRGADYAVALEGALKLKEISYIHAEAYAAGELKHGTISLIEEGMPVIAVVNGLGTLEKMVSNIIEVRSRGAFVVVFSSLSSQELRRVADYFVAVPPSPFASLISVIDLQLLAYYIALARNCDIDKPRNLAKSVTVE